MHARAHARTHAHTHARSYIRAEFTETYTFTAVVDEAVRVVIGGAVVFDTFTGTRWGARMLPVVHACTNMPVVSMY
jgi:hypothetical protein